MTVDVFDSDKLSDDEHLGSLDLDLAEIQSSASREVWYDLDKVGKIKIQTTWFPVSTKVGDTNTMKSSRVLNIFIGKIFTEKLKIDEEKQYLSISIETEKDKKISKAVQVNNRDFGIINEGFMIMMRNKEQKMNIKLINNNEELCQKYISISEFDEEVVHSLSINSVKVDINIKSGFLNIFQYNLGFGGIRVYL